MRSLIPLLAAVMLGCPPSTEDPKCPHCADNDDQDGDGFTKAGGDCDDADAALHPEATELCDLVDNNCDGSIDEGALDALPWYPDVVGDGAGDASGEVLSCEVPTDYVEDDSDCDDTNPKVLPGQEELCDLLDNDCDGTVDEDDATDAPQWYLDADGDEHGAGSPVTSCQAPESYVASDDDCDDTLAEVNPSATEVCSDGLDNDCNESDDGCIKVGTSNLDSDSDIVDVWIQGTEEHMNVGGTLATLPALDGEGLPGILVTSGYWSDDVHDQVFLLDETTWEEPECSLAPGRPGVAATFGNGSTTAGLGTAVSAGLDSAGQLIIALGAPGVSEGLGAVYVLAYGGEAGTISVTTSELVTSVLLGTDTYIGAGTALSLGDFSGDGEPDLLIGTPGVDDGGGSIGAIFLIPGPLDGGGQVITAAASGGFYTTGATTGAGREIAIIGDMDGDGISEAVFGAPDTGETNDGRAYIFWGGDITGPMDLTGDADVMLTVSASSGQSLGSALADAGDLDGDGRHDLLVGAPAYDGGRGRAYVVWSSADLIWGDISAHAAMLNGDSGMDQAGSALTGLGDLNGDGELDLAIGAPGHSAGTGRAYVVYGPISTGTTELDAADLILEGDVAAGRAGLSIGGGTDLDGDGLTDLLVGVPQFSEALVGPSIGGLAMIRGRGW